MEGRRVRAVQRCLRGCLLCFFLWTGLAAPALAQAPLAREAAGYAAFAGPAPPGWPDAALAYRHPDGRVFLYDRQRASVGVVVPTWERDGGYWYLRGEQGTHHDARGDWTGWRVSYHLDRPATVERVAPRGPRGADVLGRSEQAWRTRSQASNPGSRPVAESAEPVPVVRTRAPLPAFADDEPGAAWDDGAWDYDAWDYGAWDGAGRRATGPGRRRPDTTAGSRASGAGVPLVPVLRWYPLRAEPDAPSRWRPGGASATSQSLGPFTYTDFDDGTSVVSQRLGSFTFHDVVDGRTRRRVSGTSWRLGNTTYHHFDDGLSGTSTQLGRFRFDDFSDGTSCVTQELGSMTFTDCR